MAWGKTAEAFLTDSTDKKLSSDGLNIWHLPDVLAKTDLEGLNTYPENYLIPDHAEAWLKTSGSSGEAQIIVKTTAQMQAEALTLANTLPFGQHC